MDIPELKCKGCQGRDKIIQNLAEEINRLYRERKAQTQEKPRKLAA